MRKAIILDCEFLCREGSLGRLWCGADDPDPVVAQIGAVKLGLASDFPILETVKLTVRPIDRFGAAFAVDRYFTELTGITGQDLEAEGIALAEALDGLDRFAEGARFWSWGKDELFMLGVSCYIAGIEPPIPARRFDNAVKLMLAAGMPAADLAKTRSGQLADYFGIAHPALRAHDALDDARSLALALQHLLRTGRVDAAALLPDA
jgi:DNA polymerase III epsilon subunit-like protein